MANGQDGQAQAQTTEAIINRAVQETPGGQWFVYASVRQSQEAPGGKQWNTREMGIGTFVPAENDATLTLDEIVGYLEGKVADAMPTPNQIAQQVIDGNGNDYGNHPFQWYVNELEDGEGHPDTAGRRVGQTTISKEPVVYVRRKNEYRVELLPAAGFNPAKYSVGMVNKAGQREGSCPELSRIHIKPLLAFLPDEWLQVPIGETFELRQPVFVKVVCVVKRVSNDTLWGRDLLSVRKVSLVEGQWVDPDADDAENGKGE